MRNTPRVLSSSCFALLFAISLAAGAGEKIEQTYVKTNNRTVARSATPLADVPNHELGQEILLGEVKYSNPAFKIKEEWVYQQFNFVGGTGSAWGTYIDLHEDGTQTFGKFEGTQKLVSNADGSWIATWEGTYKLIGGTGKYKNIKGSGTYKGKATSAGDSREDGKETIEY